MGRLLGRDVKRDLAMHVYIPYLTHSVYMEIFFLGRFSSPPGNVRIGVRYIHIPFANIEIQYRFFEVILNESI